jgi:hypothetical protein
LQRGLFQHTGPLSKSPARLSANVHQLQAQQAGLGGQIQGFCRRYYKGTQEWRDNSLPGSGADSDLLFESTYSHHRGRTCKDCDRTKAIDRDACLDTDPQIHYDNIGPGSAVIKDATKRDQVRKDKERLTGDVCVWRWPGRWRGEKRLSLYEGSLSCLFSSVTSQIRGHYMPAPTPRYAHSTLHQKRSHV